MLCEICGAECADWRLDSENVLDRCIRCGHVHRDLMRAPAGARRHPWGGVGTFDRIRLALTWRSQERALVEVGLQVQDLLEIGFGAGLMMVRHLEQKRNVQGSEAEMLERPAGDDLLQRIVHHGVPAEKLELAPASLDLFYGIHVIEHLQDPRRVFAIAASALRPGGVVHFLTPAGDSAGLANFGAAWWNLEDPTHIRFFSPESLRLALAEAGFEEISVRRPWWDSIGVEAASSLRKLGIGAATEHGALGSGLGKLLLLALMPVFVVMRAVAPELRPSLEVIARRRADP